ncbi:hypothetical protein EYF80_039194 [Liparis tanakae]|uniref:Uncharacterized protein n=1 Tax=Liparis tanakae TaxID=230148 RepID=A0A4Z2GBJ7_9TELE|nr:hypothetical protein EYF80_039194 [Liparis tanakae]
MASPCRFLRDVASASDWTQVSSRSRLRRCSSASRFLFASFCKPGLTDPLSSPLQQTLHTCSHSSGLCCFVLL